MGIIHRALLNGQSDDINKMRICNGFVKYDFFQLNLETSQVGGEKNLILPEFT